MKTNQILTRKMGEFGVSQRTSDGYFDGNALLYQWNRVNGNTRRRMDDFLDSVTTKEFIETISKRESKRGNFAIPDFQVVMKGRVKTNKDGSKEPAKIWMHPFLFIDFSMWINSEFKYDVIKFVYDELIRYRNDAGDAYRELSSAVARITGKSFLPVAMQRVAKGVNCIVFGSHESEIRNKQAEENKMRELFELERKLASLINEGFITNYECLINYMKRLWIDKYQPKVLSTD